MATDPPLITTIIPTYRRPHLLRRAIRSVLSQTYPHFQVCIYDNASGDETAAVVTEFMRDDPRVRYHCHTENIGMSANFTYAMERIDTSFFSILSDDDYLLPTFYETAMEGFDRHPDAMFSATSVIAMTEKGEITHIPMNLWEREGYFAPPEGLLAWTIAKHPYITGLLFRGEVMERVGLLDRDIFHADYEYEWRVVSRFPYVVSKQPCVVIVIHESQATRASDVSIWLHSYDVIRERLRQNETLAPADGARAEAMLTASFASALFVVGLTAIRDGHLANARAIGAVLSRQFHRRQQGVIVSALAGACSRFRPIHTVLQSLYTLLIRFRTLRDRNLKRRISDYGPY